MHGYLKKYSYELIAASIFVISYSSSETHQRLRILAFSNCDTNKLKNSFR